MDMHRQAGAQPPRATIIVAHGGQVSSHRPTSRTQPAVLRMIPIARALRRALPAERATVLRHRFEVRGWNAKEASPAGDLRRLLDRLAETGDGTPTLLVGHSMGGRAVLRAADHPLVTAVVALAPWLPAGERPDQLAGRQVLLVHGSADTVTDPEATWAYADTARRPQPTADIKAIEIRGGDHAMLRRASLWHRLTTEFCLTALDLPGRHAVPADALAAERADTARVLL